MTTPVTGDGTLSPGKATLAATGTSTTFGSAALSPGKATLAALGSVLGGGPLTSRLYARLPEAHRDPDPALNYPLLRYLETAGGDGDAVEELLDRLETDLADPHRADVRWLPWLAQLVGLDVRDEPEDVRRDRIADGSGFTGAGTRRAIEVAARTALTGSRYAAAFPFLNGDTFQIGLRVVASEVPDPAAVAGAVAAAGALPAGFTLGLDYYAASWGTVQTVYPTWQGWHAAGSWQALSETNSPNTTTAAPKALNQGAWGEGAAG